MKCLKCNQVFLSVNEVSEHMKTDHSIISKKAFNCLQCEEPFEELSVFKEHLGTCNTATLNDVHTELNG